MATPTIAWDETRPVGETEYIRDGDDRIREMKTQIREILAVDHMMESSGSDTDWGYHKQLTLLEQADVGAGTTGICALGAQTVSDKPELTFTDEDNNDVQITKDGFLNGDALVGSGVIASDTLKEAIVNFLYPVGKIYISEDSTSPADFLGVGTWVLYSVGKVLVGIDSTDSDFGTAGGTGGEKTHTLTKTEIPAHTHNVFQGNSEGAGSGVAPNSNQSGATPATSSTGGGGAHNNLQPYVVVYMWKRTA